MLPLRPLRPAATAFSAAIVVIAASFAAAADVLPEFENAISGAPSVTCDRSSISLNIHALHGAPSVVFAKGHFGKEGCSFRNQTHVTFDFEKCNIRRKREVNPRGMAYTMTVVVQLHPLFITKVDRAYAVRCFYMEAEKSVGAELGVSELTTQSLAQDHAQPQCVYSLHKDSPNGPVLKYARVGDVVYHVWDCPSDVYAMLVHSCIVQDGQGHEHRVIDESGCSTDLYLMPELSYANDLTKTFTASNAFNFPDDATVQFSCQIKLCFKDNIGCDMLTPPKCGLQASIDRKSAKDELETEQLMTTDSHFDEATEIFKDPIFGEVHDGSTSSMPSTSRSESTISEARLSSTTTGGISSSTRGSAPTVTATLASTTTTVPSADTNGNITEFPTPRSIREFIRKKYGNSVEGSGFEAELDEREQMESQERRDIRRRDTDTLDLDISSPELTILDKDIGNVDTSRSSALSGLSGGLAGDSSLLSREAGVCVPISAFWLLIALVLLSLSFVLVAVCKGHAKQGFVQF